MLSESFHSFTPSPTGTPPARGRVRATASNMPIRQSRKHCPSLRGTSEAERASVATTETLVSQRSAQRASGGGEIKHPIVQASLDGDIHHLLLGEVGLAEIVLQRSELDDVLVGTCLVL